MLPDINESNADAATGDPDKNVILLAIDDLFDYKRFSEYFGIDLQMPNLERIAAKGVTFASNSTASPQCNPSRTALLTGESPFKTGVYQNMSFLATDVASNHEFLPLHFATAGYKTALAGKVFHGVYEQVAQDFDVAVAIVDHVEQGLVTEQQYADYKISEFGKSFFSQSDTERPFFLSLGYHKPHVPWIVPEKYYDLFDINKISDVAFDPNDLNDVPQFFLDFVQFTAGPAMVLGSDNWKNSVLSYAASARFVDDMIGRLLDEIDQRNLWETTTVVLFSDHGYHLGDKGVGGKFSLYETSLSSPLIIADPDVGNPGTTTHRPTSLLDLFPTLAELTGVTVPGRIEGTSLVPLMLNTDADLGRGGILSTIGGGISLRTDSFRYNLYNDGSEEVFDAHLDPLNQTNLAIDSRYDETTLYLRETLRQELQKFDLRVVDANETVAGEADNETFFVLPGGTAIGGDGNDTYFLTEGSNFIELEGGGYDNAFVSFLGTYEVPAQIERVELTMHAPTDILGNARENEIWGSWHANEIRGLAGDDYIVGKQGNDKIWGGKGNDRIFGHWGRDQVFGGAGNDEINGDRGSDILHGGIGRDAIDGGSGDDSLRGGRGKDVLQGGDGNDLLWGGRKRDFLFGGAGEDKLVGNKGNDIVKGKQNADRLFGGLGADTLKGGNGADRIAGGAGNDTLFGGSGADVFVFDVTIGTGSDKLKDFEAGRDVIEFLGGARFADISIAKDGGNTIVTWDTGDLTIVGVEEELGSADFVFF